MAVYLCHFILVEGCENLMGAPELIIFWNLHLSVCRIRDTELMNFGFLISAIANGLLKATELMHIYFLVFQVSLSEVTEILCYGSDLYSIFVLLEFILGFKYLYYLNPFYLFHDFLMIKIMRKFCENYNYYFNCGIIILLDLLFDIIYMYVYVLII